MWRDEIRNGIGKKIIEITALCVCLLVTVLGWNDGFFLPRWIDWKNGTAVDVSGRYEAVQKHRMVDVICDNSVIWESSKDIKVQDAMFCDIDGDETDELVLLCWKIGRFGTGRPFWVEEDEKTWSQHIFVYSCEGGTIKPKWMSSYIGVDVAEMAASDHRDSLMGDMAEHDGVVGRQPGSTVTDAAMRHSMPARQRLLLTDTNGKVSSWLWESWGFTKEDTDVSFVAFGDNLIHEPIYQYGLHNNEKNENNSSNFDFLFEDRNIENAIVSSDIAIINQETPFTNNPSKYSGYPRFGTPTGVGEAIADAGFDVVTCATNHALDQGMDGLAFTKEFFDSHDIMCIGIQSVEEEEYRPYEILVRGGVRIALLNYTYGINGSGIPQDMSYRVHVLDDEERIRADIAGARAETDFVLVFAHWGTEYEQEPDEFQQKWSQIFLESGVDVVIGTHPHVLQPYEVLRDEDNHEMLVYYSIGNYISAQKEQSCVKGGMAHFTVSLTPDGYKITEYALQPLVITRQEDGKYTVDFPAEY